MIYKVTTPEQMLMEENDVAKLEETINRFEAELQQVEKGQKRYELFVSGRCSRWVSDKVEEAYRAAGWDVVVCVPDWIKDECHYTKLILITDK